MRIPFISKKKRHQRRSTSTEQASKKIDLHIKRFASNALIEMCTDDPELKRAVVARVLNLKLPKRDPLIGLREELLHQVNRIAKEQLDNDPKKAEAIAKDWIRQLIGDLGSGEVDQKSLQPNDDLMHLLERVKMMEQIKQVMGIPDRGSLRSVLGDPQVIAAVLGFLKSLLSLYSQTGGERTLTALIDGVQQTVPKSTFHKLRAEGRVQPLAEVKSPETDIEKTEEEAGTELGPVINELPSPREEQLPQASSDPDSN